MGEDEENIVSSVHLTKEQREFIKSKNLNFSAWVRQKVDEEMEQERKNARRV
jgi:hypothetical protein